jgi:hypothetical protein
MVNDFKDYIQNLEIVTNFELTETIIKENFKQLFEKLIEGNTGENDNFNLIQTNLKAFPRFKDMENFFSMLIKTDEVMKQFDAQRSFIEKFQDDSNLQFNLMNSLMTNGFEGISSAYKNVDERNFEIMEEIRQISTNIQDGFRGLQIPANVITDSLLTRVEGQYQVYLNNDNTNGSRE